jgi:uncharacterized protein YbaA (DUF1428 family)
MSNGRGRVRLVDAAPLAQSSGDNGDRTMGRYIDGFVLPVPKSNIEAYRRMAETAAQVWREYGALEYVECIADDVKPGKVTSFPQAVQLKDDETVVFAWIVYESREQRDAINDKVMKDPRLAGIGPGELPFDGQRMFWGGFETFVTA